MDGLDSYGRSPVERDDHARDRNRDSFRDRRPPRGGRNRSRSPVQIDRYQPDRARDDYYSGARRDDHTRNRRRSSPSAPAMIDRYVPGDEPPMQRPIPVNQIRDPLLESMQVGFSYFSEWWRAEQDIKQQKERQKNGGRRPEPVKESREEQRARIQAAYDEYKLNWNARMAKVFVHAHKYDNWFKERYVPEVRDPLRARVQDFRRGLYMAWDQDLQGGIFDEFTMEGIYKSESNGAGGVVEKEEGEAVAAAEVLAVSDLVPAKGGDIRDPVASLPTLLLKTITGAVSRDKVEEFCKEHLGEGEGGYKWLSLSDPNPGKKFHRLGWVMLHPGPDRAAEDTSRDRDGRDEDEVEGMQVKDETEDKAANLLSTSERACKEINDKTIHDPEKGDFTVHVGIHRPSDMQRKKALWDLFSAPERIEKDLNLAIRLTNKLDADLGLEYSGVSKVEEKVDELAGKGWLQPPIVSSSKDSKAGKDDDDADMEDGEEEEEGGIKEDETDDEEMLIKKKKLDLLVEYLRRVHNFCFFCVFECDSVHELQRKCAGGHLRRPRDSLTTAAKEIARASANGEDFPSKKQDNAQDGEGDASPVEEKKSAPRPFSGKNQLQKAFNWVKTFEEKVLQILEPENVDLKKLGGKPLEEGLEEELSKFVKQEDESKYRCKVPDCAKLFKGVSFWRKHVEKRHTEWFEKLKEDIELINRYVLDPSRLAQGRNDASSNGHFPMNNGTMSGTPRNFTLGNMPLPNNFLPGMAGPPPIMNPYMGGYAVGMPPQWGLPGGDHGGGPIRMGGRLGNPRNQGPYGGGPRRRDSGRLSPPRGGGARGSRGYMEGGSGQSFVSSNQSVEGRTMKSYNDLDATTGNGETTQLDY